MGNSNGTALLNERIILPIRCPLSHASMLIAETDITSLWSIFKVKRRAISYEISATLKPKFIFIDLFSLYLCLLLGNLPEKSVSGLVLSIIVHLCIYPSQSALHFPEHSVLLRPLVHWFVHVITSDSDYTLILIKFYCQTEQMFKMVDVLYCIHTMENLWDSFYFLIRCSFDPSWVKKRS